MAGAHTFVHTRGSMASRLSRGRIGTTKLMALGAAGVFAAISSQLAAQVPRATAVGFTAAQAERGQRDMPNTARRVTARTSTMARSRRRCRGWTSGRSGVTNHPRRCSRRPAPRCRRRGPALSATRRTRSCWRTSCARTACAPGSGRSRPRRRRSRRWRCPRGRAAAAADSHRAPPCRRLQRAPTRCRKSRRSPMRCSRAPATASG